jgi:uncharacterized protein
MAQQLLRRGEKAPMQYRRFGKTNLALSVVTLGGMRYDHGWDSPREELPRRSIEQCRDVVRAAFDAGVNHIETAHGYVKSEGLYGKVLNEELRLPRDSYFFMTKGSPETGDDMQRLVERQLKTLGMDYFDSYAWHGINTPRRYRAALHPGGPVEALKRLQEQGVIRHVGFSTHGSYRLITDAISTGLFEFVNLHYYYFWQRNWGAVQLAAERDMGVFIISPNDKGGRLFDPPPLLRELTAPLTPIQYNARFCLRTPHVHTLSFGMTEPAHVAEMRGMFPVSVPLAPADQQRLQRLDARLGLGSVRRLRRLRAGRRSVGHQYTRGVTLQAPARVLRHAGVRALSLQHGPPRRRVVCRRIRHAREPGQGALRARARRRSAAPAARGNARSAVHGHVRAPPRLEMRRESCREFGRNSRFARGGLIAVSTRPLVTAAPSP